MARRDDTWERIVTDNFFYGVRYDDTRARRLRRGRPHDLHGDTRTEISYSQGTSFIAHTAHITP